MTDSHHWLNAVGLFPSNFSGFSIFSRDVCILASTVGCSSCLALCTPSATNRTNSWVVIVGVGFLGGERWGRRGGRGGSDGGPEGGPMDDPGGFEGGFPPCPSVGPSTGGLGGMWPRSSDSRRLISGVGGNAGGLCRRVGGPGFKRSGLPSAGGECADGALVLVCRAGLLQVGGAGGVAGSGILAAMRWISVLASRSWSSREATQLW